MGIFSFTKGCVEELKERADWENTKVDLKEEWKDVTPKGILDVIVGWIVIIAVIALGIGIFF